MRFQIVLLIFIFIVPCKLLSQTQKGRVLSVNNAGIGYVNIGIIGKNVGTVSDQDGYFTIRLDDKYNNDSLRFSMIGYESKTFQVGRFKTDSVKTVFLNSKVYSFSEVKIIYHRPRKIRLGTPVFSNDLRSGFSNNDLGSELGIKVDVKGHVILKNINLNVAVCTYDSVTYRLNIYRSVNATEYKNILTEPIYISFSKDKINKVVTFDLSKYSIIISGNALITLELYKNLGEGSLLFHTSFFTDTTYHKKTSEGKWSKAPGEIGMYLDGDLIR
jgi:CarboxypepD_reg-like domain